MDDEPGPLGMLLDALTRRFGGDYRIVPFLAAQAALAALTEMKGEGDEIALVIADQWMPGMNGNELLARVHRIERLTQRAYQQAWLFGAKFVFARAVSRLAARGVDRVLELSDGREIVARAVIVATGASYRRAIPRVDRFVGAGVFYTTFVVPTARDRDVVVVGGGNSAGQAVLHLARGAHRAVLVVRADALERSMSDYLVQQIRRSPNIDVRLRAEIVDADGEHRLERVTIRDATGATESMTVGLLVVLIGVTPRTEWLAGAVERDRRGFVLTGSDLPSTAWRLSRFPMRLETSVPGVFAAGDVRHGSVKRVASAVGEGAVAVQHVHESLASLQGDVAVPGAPRRPAGAGAPPGDSVPLNP